MPHLRRYIAILLSLCLAGCLANRARPDTSRQVQVFGIELYSGVDYREINGIRATEEPCLKGYERGFDRLEITIGYGFDGRIRKIFTRNPATSMFGITPGISAEDGRKLARQAGFNEQSPDRYRNGDIILSLLVDGHNRLFGISIETID
jgi:hypothetical protein